VKRCSAYQGAYQGWAKKLRAVAGSGVLTMPPGVDVETLLSQIVLRGLGDKLYDKRKAAALEVEQLVKNLAKEVGIFSRRKTVVHSIFPLKSESAGISWEIAM
jgi:hypothetical protein